jgi:hypothetical protein
MGLAKRLDKSSLAAEQSKERGLSRTEEPIQKFTQKI